jgi:hypothetical protein
MLEIALGESINSLEANIAAYVNGEYVSNVPGSEAMVGNGGGAIRIANRRAIAKLVIAVGHFPLRTAKQRLFLTGQVCKYTLCLLSVEFIIRCWHELKKSLFLDEKWAPIALDILGAGLPKLDTPVRFWSPAFVFEPKTKIFQCFSSPSFFHRHTSVLDIPPLSGLWIGLVSVWLACGLIVCD